MELGIIRERDGGFGWPGAIFCRVWNSARLMFQASRFQIFGDADLKTFWVGFALQDVNLTETH